MNLKLAKPFFCLLYTTAESLTEFFGKQVPLKSKFIQNKKAKISKRGMIYYSSNVFLVLALAFLEIFTLWYFPPCRCKLFSMSGVYWTEGTIMGTHQTQGETAVIIFWSLDFIWLIRSWLRVRNIISFCAPVVDTEEEPCAHLFNVSVNLTVNLIWCTGSPWWRFPLPFCPSDSDHQYSEKWTLSSAGTQKNNFVEIRVLEYVNCYNFFQHITSVF